MSIIEVKKLSKDFKVKTKEKGFKGSIKSMFKPKYKIVHAVKNINLNIENFCILIIIFSYFVFIIYLELFWEE